MRENDGEHDPGNGPGLHLLVILALVLDGHLSGDYINHQANTVTKLKSIF